MKKIILHVGLHKTGTTAFQGYLKANKDALLNGGVFVPPTDKVLLDGKSVMLGRRGGCHVIPRMLIKDNYRPLRAFLDCFEKSGARTAIMSSEGFDKLSHDDIQNLSGFLKDYDVSIVLCLRHPLSLARSLYCSRGGIKKLGPKKYLARAINNPIFNYPGIVSDWSRVFGREQVSVIKFEDNPNIVQTLASNLEIHDLIPEDKFPRSRVSIPASAAIALSDLSRGLALDSDADLMSTLYPYFIQYVEEVAPGVNGAAASPFQKEDQSAFLRSWGTAYPGSKFSELGLDGFDDYQVVPDNVSVVNPLDVTELKRGFLWWVFSEKLPQKNIDL